jgi:hypothetical protein
VEFAVLKATVGQVREKYAFSERRACRLMTLAVTTYRYRSRRSDERCARSWWSWRGRSRALDIGGCMCCCGGVENE